MFDVACMTLEEEEMEFKEMFGNYGKTLTLDEKIKGAENIPETKEEPPLHMQDLKPLFEKLASQHETLIEQNNQMIQLLQKIAVR